GQTLHEPDGDRLPDGYGRVEVKDLSPMFDKLTKDRAVHYRITASASKRKPLDPPAPPGSNKRGPIVPLRGREAERWWRTQAERAGLELRSLTSSPVG